MEEMKRTHTGIREHKKVAKRRRHTICHPLYLLHQLSHMSNRNPAVSVSSSSSSQAPPYTPKEERAPRLLESQWKPKRKNEKNNRNPTKPTTKTEKKKKRCYEKWMRRFKRRLRRVRNK
jgi:hypothetical protein